ncbi:MAG: LPS export ABC transporter permease LptG [Proteobacteria bacterium]|nr:LPS export ABC transporter permease LptG [Pseudomonadota bacterium]
MIAPSSTLFRYISRQFLVHLLILMLILLGIVMIFDIIEFLRRAATLQQLPFGLLLSMSLMKLPYLGERILPMGVLFASIYTCWKLNRTSELVVIRSAGLSAWQFLSPIILCAMIIGGLSTAVLNPVSSIFLSRYQQLDRVYLQNNVSLITVSKTGIWLRQPSEQGYALIHSDSFDQKAWQLNKVIILFFDKQDNFLRRIDSPIAYLRDGYWDIHQLLLSDKKGGLQSLETQRIPTELTSQKIEESFADPDTISFWSIPEYIHIMEDTGFPVTRISLHFHALLAQPFLFAAMILLAATFSLRLSRLGGIPYLVVLGVAVGFFIFFLQSILEAFGISQKIPVLLAAWSPAMIGLLLGSAALLHLEDG